MRYICTTSDNGILYTSNSITSIGKKLHNYIRRNYGEFYTVITNKNNAYTNSTKINKPGTYTIVTSKATFNVEINYI